MALQPYKLAPFAASPLKKAGAATANEHNGFVYDMSGRCVRRSLDGIWH